MQIENNIEIPKEENKPKAKRSRARRAAAEKPKVSESAISLIKALEFVSVAQKKNGPPQLQFCKISNGWVAASNEILTVAHPIAEDLEACPHTIQFLDALKEAGKDASLGITQLTGSALAVTATAFRGLVPCVDPAAIQISPPDPLCGQMSDSVKTALLACAPLVSESAQYAHFCAVMLKSGLTVATNGQSLLEYWHGIDLPPEGFLMPKSAALAIGYTPYTLTGFGFSQSSVTFYFENGAFIKTQLYSEVYPQYSNFLKVENPKWWKVPKEFFEGLKALEPFGKGYAYFEKETLYSDESKDIASSYKVEGLPGKMAFNIRQLLMLKNRIEKIHFEAEGYKILFMGENCRGICAGLQTNA